MLNVLLLCTIVQFLCGGQFCQNLVRFEVFLRVHTLRLACAVLRVGLLARELFGEEEDILAGGTQGSLLGAYFIGIFSLVITSRLSSTREAAEDRWEALNKEPKSHFRDKSSGRMADGEAIPALYKEMLARDVEREVNTPVHLKNDNGDSVVAKAVKAAFEDGSMDDLIGRTISADGATHDWSFSAIDARNPGGILIWAYVYAR